MKHIFTLNTGGLCGESGGCGECRTSCQSACKTSSGVANQSCENTGRIRTLKTRDLAGGEGGCGECRTSCQSACKTYCGVANQPCENV